MVCFHSLRCKTPTATLGKFVVKLCDAPRDRRATKTHNLFKLYKWNEAKHAYERTNNKELLADPSHSSYRLVYNLFDNYESDETKPEVNTKEECQEIMDFLNYVVDSEPLKVEYPHYLFSRSEAINRLQRHTYVRSSVMILVLIEKTKRVSLIE